MAEIKQGTELESEIRTLGNLELFLYSASVQIPHRIHYDLDYAREEGHRDILVHGPFQAVCMVQQALGGLGDDWRATKVSFRNLSPVLVDAPFECASSLIEVSEDGEEARVEIISRSLDGQTVFTTGELVVRRGA
ncbi:MAG: hypothetical protein WED83_02480 [Acidimicrobiia bacterium]